MSENLVRTLRTLFRGRVITVESALVWLPGGNSADYEICRHPGSAAVVAIDEADRVCLLRQYRPAVGSWVWELPAGRREPAESPEQTARRELAEEAGYEAGAWQPLGSLLSSPGVLSEEIYLFLATRLTARPVQHQPYEAIEIHWLEFSDALRRAMSGEIRDAKTVAAMVRASALRKYQEYSW